MHSEFEPMVLQRPSVDTARHLDRPVSSLPAFFPQSMSAPAPTPAAVAPARLSNAHRNRSWPLLRKAVLAAEPSIPSSGSLSTSSVASSSSHPVVSQSSISRRRTAQLYIEALPKASGAPVVFPASTFKPRPMKPSPSEEPLSSLRIPAPSRPTAAPPAKPASKPLLTSENFPFPSAPCQTSKTHLQIPTPKPALAFKPHKRSRPASDVDGSHTQDLSLKKRRLAFQFATSRLSPPFSLPASHILNRELALTATTKLLRMLSPEQRLGRARGLGQAVQFRRLVALNWMRVGLDTRGGWVASQEPVPRARNAAVEGVNGSTGDRLHQDSIATRKPVVKACPHVATLIAPSPRAVAASREELSQPEPLLQASHPDPEPHKTDDDEVYEISNDDDEDSAFPMASFAGQYADDPEEVYSDFGLIFSPGSGHPPLAAAQPGPTAQQVAHRMSCPTEDSGYLDEMDGITWTFR
ncbi:hypothetical protein BROUX41_003381 [Berkeleyomyces rouxiae]|uniref:uncharacterized protein n=1 Tax=Berkeleyomyces rouxiae TaxID=2035830 RepID=UPI003B7A8EAB